MLEYYDAPVGHVGAAGAAEGAARRRRSVDSARRSSRAWRRSCTRRSWRRTRSTRSARSKVRLEEYVRRRGKELTEVKRGRGGIRDVEFAVQLLQIVHGRRDERLREPNTLARAGRARGGGVRRARPTPRRSPTRTGSCGRSSTGCRSCATCRRTISRADPHGADDARALAGARRTPTSCRTSTNARRTLVRGLHERLFYRPLLEAFAGRARPGRASTARRPRSCSPASGSRRPPQAYEVLGASSTPPRGSARCSRTCSR